MNRFIFVNKHLLEMKKVLLFSLVSLFIISCGTNATDNTNENARLESSSVDANEVSVDTANAPIITMTNDTFNFGEAKEGDKVSHEFEFVNDGNTPLIISSVTASCGCTTPNYPKQPIQPGEKSKIEVVFDTKNQPGMQHKVITMFSNAHPNRTLFHLKGEVK